jgi:DNA-binding NtrC family response regulator
MAKHKLLFIDDEAHILESLSQIFDMTYEVHTETDGHAAIEYAKRTPELALIISDQRMPKMKGIEVLKNMKEVVPNATRILLTGFADADAIMDSVNVGSVFRYIKKPWNPAELEEVVRLGIANHEAKLKLTPAVPTSATATEKPAATPASALAMQTLAALSKQVAASQPATKPAVSSAVNDAMTQLEKQRATEEKFFEKLSAVSAGDEHTVQKAFHGSSGKPKILIVDDEQSVLTALSELLSDMYDVIVCKSADEALKRLEEDSFVTLILTDQRMPKKNGTELLIESKTHAPLVPKVLITAYTDVEDIVRLINEGQIYRYIQKPWNAEKLRETITEAVEMYKMQIAGALTVSQKTAAPTPTATPSTPMPDAKALQAMAALQKMKKPNAE